MRGGAKETVTDGTDAWLRACLSRGYTSYAEFLPL